MEVFKATFKRVSKSSSTTRKLLLVTLSLHSIPFFSVVIYFFFQIMKKLS